MALKVFKTQVINDWERTRKGARVEQQGESPRTSAQGNQAEGEEGQGLGSCHSVDAAEGS